MKKKISILVIVFILLLGVSIPSYLIYKENMSQKEIKYVFLFIGDGMNANHVELTEIYNNSIQKKKTKQQERISFSDFSSIGLRKNYDNNTYIPDSASTATGIASGLLTNSGMINMDTNNKSSTPITYLLKQKRNMKIGIVTTVPINHATPAGFYANVESRTQYDAIANQLTTSGFDYFGDGGFKLENLTVDEIYSKLQENGYHIVDTKEEIQNLNQDSGKVIAINPNQEDGFTKYGMNATQEDLQLSDFVKKGIEVLDNDNGFFMMIESGMIDLASHNNDARGVVSEVTVLNEAVEEALTFYKKHPDETLILVTGDHETGGLGLGTQEKGYSLELDVLQNQTKTYPELQQYVQEEKDRKEDFLVVWKYLEENFGFSLDDFTKVRISKDSFEELKQEYEQGNSLARKIIDIVNERAGVGWTTYDHTGAPVMVYAYGKNSDQFEGSYTTSEFNTILKKVLQIK